MLTITNLNKVYKNGKLTVDVLKNINTVIKDGALCAITGPSGSGKTTLMNLIGLLDKPTSGSIEIDGVTTEKLSDTELAKFRNKAIGFVFQAFHLLPSMDALDNVGLPLMYRGVSRKSRLEIAEHWLSKVGLSDRMKHRPDELSGGQKQRVAIARALVTDPSLILADEPTGNLDTKTADEIMKLFVDLNNDLNTTIVIVTHDNDIANACTSLINITDGVITKSYGQHV